MKIIIYFIFILISYTASAQTQAEWKLPQVEIPLMKGEQTIAILKPKYFTKTAILSFDGEEYQFKLKSGSSRCIVTKLSTKEVIAQLTQMGSREVKIQFAKAPEVLLKRIGKKDNRQYVLPGELSLKISEEGITTNFEQIDLNQCVVQAALVFRHTFIQYDKDRASNTYYYPVIITS
ncbi:MAG: hypothetical protein MUF39_04835 [Cyclobacteriaceae bacterium]|nr:hypothetical protein [Cyclobacteriaceae bacterium]